MSKGDVVGIADRLLDEDAVAPDHDSRLMCCAQPRIHRRHIRLFEIPGIARKDSQAVVQGRRGDDQIRLGKRMSAFSAFFDQ